MRLTDRVLKIAQHELQTGCLDKAVIGGIENFLTLWRQQSLPLAKDDAERRLVEAVGQSLSGYTRLSRPERRRAVEQLLQWLAAPPDAARVPPVPLPSDAVPVDLTSAGTAPAGTDANLRMADLQGARAGPRVREPDLTDPATVLRGISKARAQRLGRLGVLTVEDLLYCFPRRHLDYSKLHTISRLFLGEDATVIGTIVRSSMRETRRGYNIVEVTISDDTGSIQASWINQPWIAKQLPEGRPIALSGKVEQYLGRLMFSAPQWDLVQAEALNTGRLVPIYPLTEGLSHRWMRRWTKQALEIYQPLIQEHLPSPVRQRARLLDLQTAVGQMHFPDSDAMLERAKRRLAFDELFLIQLIVLRQRHQWQAQPATALRVDRVTLNRFIEGLPFTLTTAQRRAIDDITQDLSKPVAMSRLVQGDVGSGKTVVAAAAAQVALENGRQVAIMAPTEILAEQHFRTLTRLFGIWPARIELLTGSLSKKEKEVIKESVQQGAVDILVGTHALIQENVRFKDVALIVVDEQHRFGVMQRAALRSKGWNPHMLVMTATPIPRTLSLTIYGDLDVTVLDEMPPLRQPVTTEWVQPSERERKYSFVRRQVQDGRQAFIICPLVEESGRLEAKAAVEEHRRLQSDIFPDLRLGLLHGRMSGKDKDGVMRAFLSGDYDILVSTSVVEIGIDVPNAAVMLIEGANRFGLAQLHQFRGRVGRGEHPSFCFLLADAGAANGDERLKLIEQTRDGFRLAEEDLKMRGPGELFGTRQSGLPDLKVANLSDLQTLEAARREALDIIARDPLLEQPDHSGLAEKLARAWQGSGDLS